MTDTEIESFIAKVSFNADGLVPVIVQRHSNSEVLMMAWMNRETLALTLTSQEMTYWSRSRQEVWKKGATSGHLQQLRDMWVDCDGDTLLAQVDQTGNACHTGSPTCFFQKV